MPITEARRHNLENNLRSYLTMRKEYEATLELIITRSKQYHYKQGPEKTCGAFESEIYELRSSLRGINDQITRIKEILNGGEDIECDFTTEHTGGLGPSKKN